MSNMPDVAHLPDLIPWLAVETANKDMPVIEPATVAAQVPLPVLAAHTSPAFWLQREVGIADQQVHLLLRQFLEDPWADIRELFGKTPV